mgnify:CR=1 FL=1
MAITSDQRNATRNQSTLDYRLINLFLYGNRYSEAVLKNETVNSQDAKLGHLVVRGTDGVLNIAGTANLADVVGVLFLEDQTLAAAEEVNVNYAISGDIDGRLLQLPGSKTLDSAVGNKTLKDVLHSLGFVVKDSVEHFKIDN